LVSLPLGLTPQAKYLPRLWRSVATTTRFNRKFIWRSIADIMDINGLRLLRSVASIAGVVKSPAVFISGPSRGAATDG